MKQRVRMPQHFFTKSNNFYDFYLPNEIIYNLSNPMLEIIRKCPIYFELYDDNQLIPNEDITKIQPLTSKQINSHIYPITFNINSYNPKDSCPGICSYVKYIQDQLNGHVYFYSNKPNIFFNIINSFDNIKIFVNLYYDSIDNIPDDVIVVQVIYDLIGLKEDSEEYYIYSNDLRGNLIKEIKRANYFIQISEPIRQEIHKMFNIPLEKIFVVQPGVNLNIFKQTRNKTSFDFYNIPEKYISCSGITNNILKHLKNIPSEFKIIDFGVVNGSFSNNVINQGGNYKNIGWVSREVETSIYSYSKQFLTTRSYEGFDMQPFEQLQCHTKVLCSHSNVHDYFLSQFENVMFYEDHTIEEIRDFLNKDSSFEHDNELLKQYTWDIQIQNLKEHLQNIFRTIDFEKKQIVDINVLSTERYYGGIAYYIKNIQDNIDNIVDFSVLDKTSFFNSQLHNIKYNISDDDIKKYDIYLNTNLAIPPQLLQRLKLSNIKIWTIVYDLMIFHKEHPSYNDWGDELRKNYVETLMASSKIITISQSIKDEIHSMFRIPLENIIIVYPGVDINRYKYNNNKRDNYILTNYAPIGGEFLRTLGINVKQSGYFPDPNTMLLRKYLPIDKYEYLGYVTSDKLLSLYFNAKAFFSAQQYEGFDMQPLEQLQCGTKVIVSHSNVHDEILPEFDNVIFYEDHTVEEVKEFLNKDISFEHDINIIKEKYNWKKSQDKVAATLLF